MGTGSYLAGLAATSGTTGATTSGDVRQRHVAALSSRRRPSACPTGFTCGDIGGPGVPTGNQLVQQRQLDAPGQRRHLVRFTTSSTTPTSHSPPAGNANGDGTVSVRVDSQSGGGAWMRSGVMIRSGTDAQAPYYGVFATPGNGVIVQWRASPGRPDQRWSAPAVTTPVYVEASRYTDTVHNVVYYSAYTLHRRRELDLLPGSTVALNLPGPLVAGMASDANSSLNLTTATFDSFAQGPPLAPPNVCPSAWTCTDIGGAAARRHRQLLRGTWTETGGGGDIWGTADSFHFAYQTMAADGTVTAHVTAQQNTSAWAKAGVMVRATTDPGSPYYAVFATPGNGIAVQWRSAQGGGYQPGADHRDRAGLPDDRPVHLGRQRLLHRLHLAGRQHVDGVPGSTQVISMTGPLLAGLALTSHNQGTGGAVTFDTVSVNATELPPPGACPSAWTCADIGTVAPGPGSQTLSGSTWNVTGFGNDIWGTADSFHYVYQPLAADGSISAQVVSQTNSSSWAKGGLMLRLTTDPGSPYYAIFATPGNGVAGAMAHRSGRLNQPGHHGGGVP